MIQPTAALETLELFAGTGSFSRHMEKHGHSVCRVENEPLNGYPVELPYDVMELGGEDLPTPDILWASPPCEGFSVAAIGRHWQKNSDGTASPKHETARHGVELLMNTMRLIEETEAVWWFVENPRGMMRTIFDQYAESECLWPKYTRHTVTYCQYGDTRMKPTDIWTNAYWWTPRPPCKNGMPCHEAAPRGSRTGTQGIKERYKRSMIPDALFAEILDAYELKILGKQSCLDCGGTGQVDVYPREWGGRVVVKEPCPTCREDER